MKNFLKAFWKRPIKLWEGGIYAGIFILIFIIFKISEPPTPAQNHQITNASTEYQTIQPQISEAFSSIKLIGKVHSNTFAMIHPRREGLIKDILVDVGDEIQVGQTLAFLFPPGVEGQSSSQIAKAKAELVAAEQALANATSVAQESIAVAQTQLTQAQTKLHNTVEGGNFSDRGQLQQDLDHAQSVADATFQNAKKILYGDTGTVQNASQIRGKFSNAKLETDIYNKYQAILQQRYLSNTEIIDQLRSLETLLRLSEELYQTSSENSQNHLALQKNRQNVLAALDRLERTLLQTDQLEISVDQASEGLNLATSQSNKSVEDAQNRVQIAHEAYQNVLSESGHVRVISPFTGIITRRLAEMGHSVHPSKALFEIEEVTTTLSQQSAQEIHFGVPESWLNQINLEDEVQVRMPHTQKSFSARITSLGTSFNAMSQTAQAQAVLTQEVFFPHNTRVYVQLQDQEHPVWSVPSTALKRKGADFYLWAINPDQSRTQIQVHVLAEDGEFSDIKSNDLTSESQIIKIASSRFFHHDQ